MNIELTMQIDQSIFEKVITWWYKFKSFVITNDIYKKIALEHK